MRNVLVVLVLSCIGLICGFIVPSGIREIRSDQSKRGHVIQNIETKPRNMIIRKPLNIGSVNHSLELLTNSIAISNNSLDDDLYENIREKDSNIEERSFIYIKPKSKRPFMKNLFDLIPNMNFDNQAVKSYVSSQPISDEKSRKKINENIAKKVSNALLGQSQHNKYQSNTNNFNNYFIDKNEIEKIATNQGKYFELAKAPLLRPIIKTNENDFITMENSLFNFTIGRNLLADIRESLFSKGAIKSNRNRKLGNKATVTKNNFNYKTGVTVNDESIAIDNYDQTVRRVIQNQLEGKPKYVNNYGFHVCRDCFKKSKKQNKKNLLKLQSNCKCGRKHLIKIIGDDILN